LVEKDNLDEEIELYFDSVENRFNQNIIILVGVEKLSDDEMHLVMNTIYYRPMRQLNITEKFN